MSKKTLKKEESAKRVISINGDRPLYFRRQDALKLFGVTPRTLQDLAMKKEGPAFFKRGKVCLYSVEEFEQWATEFPVQTTD